MYIDLRLIGYYTFFCAGKPYLDIKLLICMRFRFRYGVLDLLTSITAKNIKLVDVWPICCRQSDIKSYFVLSCHFLRKTATYQRHLLAQR